eukprot:9088921-Pyramimonas_sp.AAC.1
MSSHVRPSHGNAASALSPPSATAESPFLVEGLGCNITIGCMVCHGHATVSSISLRRSVSAALPARGSLSASLVLSLSVPLPRSVRPVIAASNWSAVHC